MCSVGLFTVPQPNTNRSTWMENKLAYSGMLFSTFGSFTMRAETQRSDLLASLERHFMRVNTQLFACIRFRNLKVAQHFAVLCVYSAPQIDRTNDDWRHFREKAKKPFPYTNSTHTYGSIVSYLLRFVVCRRRSSNAVTNKFIPSSVCIVRALRS